MIFFLRKIKTPKKNEAGHLWIQQMGKVQFRNDLLCSQIDTIFSGLNAILESERLKVRTLLASGNAHCVGAQATTAETIQAMDAPAPQPVDGDAAPVETHFAVHTGADGMQDEVCLSSGLSQSEIELATAMGSRAAHPPVRKLEAVA
jgi:hypothetical protein